MALYENGKVSSAQPSFFQKAIKNWSFPGGILNILCRGKSDKAIQNHQKPETKSNKNSLVTIAVLSYLKTNMVRKVKHYQLKSVCGKTLNEKVSFSIS